MSDESILRKLNDQYIGAYMTADVAWYDRQLAENFVCHGPDGSILDKKQFLHKTAEGPDVTEYRLMRVRVRFNGDTAAVDGTGAYTLPDGSKGTSRYTDVYKRMGPEWKVISAHIERVLTAGPKVGTAR